MVTNGRPVEIHIFIPFCFNEHNAFLIFGVISVFPISSNVPSISKKIIFTLFISFLSSSLFSYVLKIVLLGSMSLISAVKRYSALGSKSIRPMDLVRSSRFRKLICYIPVLIHPLNMHHSCSAYPIPSINIFANIPYLLVVHRPHKLGGHNCP